MKLNDTKILDDSSSYEILCLIDILGDIVISILLPGMVRRFTKQVYFYPLKSGVAIYRKHILIMTSISLIAASLPFLMLIN